MNRDIVWADNFIAKILYAKEVDYQALKQGRKEKYPMMKYLTIRPHLVEGQHVGYWFSLQMDHYPNQVYTLLFSSPATDEKGKALTLRDEFKKAFMTMTNHYDVAIKRTETHLESTKKLKEWKD